MAEQRSSVRVLVVYSVARLLLFAVPFLVIWALSGNPVLSAVVAAVIGLALSVVLLDFQRRALARALGDRVDRRRPSSDEAAEDRALEAGIEDEDEVPEEGATQNDSAAARPRP